MTEGSINKVLYTVDQRADTTAAEKKTARDNIGAVGADDIPDITDQRYKPLQTPVLQTFSANAVIDRLEQDAQGVTTVHCSYLGAATASSDGLMPAADKAKLDGIQAGAEVNVQSDWAQTDTGADDFIRNKPAIPVLPPTKELVAGTGITIVEGADEVTISSQMDAVDKAKLDSIQAGAEVNVQADWAEADTSSDAYIRNKPGIPTKTSDLTNDSGFITAQVNADWNASSGVAEILNKPALSAVKRTTASLPPVSTQLSELEFFTDGRVRGDSSDMGLLVPYPAKADSGKILQAVWAGSPAIGSTIWTEKPTVVDYIAGTGLSSTVDQQTGDVTFTWAYTVGRNLEVNPNNELCTSIPGALDNASTTIDAIFHEVTNGKFAGAYVLMTRQNANNTYDIGIRYTASGKSSTISFVGTETVIANDNTVTVNPAIYMNQKVTYTGNKFGTTTFNPATHKAIYYSGLAMIGPLSDTKIAIFKDAGDHVKVAFTSVEAKLSW